jgi:predicted HTH transcriptional regulator
MVDQAVDFVLSKIDRAIGTREHSIQAPETYELPVLAVKEAIVNAVAHRDYTSNASVQVMLFADRLEVWNPGHLPPTLTMARLRQPHASIPHNPLIADPLYLVRYVEQAGTGIIDAIGLCHKAGLPEPEFRQDGGQFIMTLWRNWLTARVLENLNLNERQAQAIAFVREKGRIVNAEYQQFTGAIKKTASRDLDDLVRKKVFLKFGTTGRGTYYRLASKGDIKGTKGTLPSKIKQKNKGDIKGTNETLSTTKRKPNPLVVPHGKGSQRAQRVRAKRKRRSQ